VVEGTGTGGLLFIGEKRGRITYATGSLSLTDLVEFELDFSFGYFYKKKPQNKCRGCEFLDLKEFSVWGKIPSLALLLTCGERKRLGAESWRSKSQPSLG
jgi:hypothetical protein